MVDGFVASKPTPADALSWSAKQAYIAQGFALAACAELEIDSCPMEGFDPVAVAQILGVPDHETVVVMLPIGYRAADESPRPKSRFSRDSLFTEIQ
jgi:nitroreductase